MSELACRSRELFDRLKEKKNIILKRYNVFIEFFLNLRTTSQRLTFFIIFHDRREDDNEDRAREKIITNDDYVEFKI